MAPRTSLDNVERAGFNNPPAFNVDVRSGTKFNHGKVCLCPPPLRKLSAPAACTHPSPLWQARGRCAPVH